MKGKFTEIVSMFPGWLNMLQKSQSFSKDQLQLIERLGQIWKKYIEWNRTMKIFLTGLLTVLYYIATIRVMIDLKLYDGLPLLVIIPILLALTFWIYKNIEKPR